MIWIGFVLGVAFALLLIFMLALADRVKFAYRWRREWWEMVRYPPEKPLFKTGRHQR